MDVYGLTGGIGSGKSTVAALLEEYGIPVVSADELSRIVVSKGSAGLADVVRRFGDDVVDETGELDRRKMASIVFQDAGQRRDLEAILHPRIRERFEQVLDALEKVGHEVTVYELPLLFEKNLQGDMKAVILVAAPEATRIHRVRTRDDVTETEVRARISAQMSQALKRKRADYVIENDGTVDELRREVEFLLARFFRVDSSVRRATADEPDTATDTDDGVLTRGVTLVPTGPNTALPSMSSVETQRLPHPNLLGGTTDDSVPIHVPRAQTQTSPSVDAPSSAKTLPPEPPGAPAAPLPPTGSQPPGAPVSPLPPAGSQPPGAPVAPLPPTGSQPPGAPVAPLPPTGSQPPGVPVSSLPSTPSSPLGAPTQPGAPAAPLPATESRPPSVNTPTPPRAAVSTPTPSPLAATPPSIAPEGRPKRARQANRTQVVTPVAAPPPRTPPKTTEPTGPAPVPTPSAVPTPAPAPHVPKAGGTMRAPAVGTKEFKEALQIELEDVEEPDEMASTKVAPATIPRPKKRT